MQAFVDQSLNVGAGTSLELVRQTRQLRVGQPLMKPLLDQASVLGFFEKPKSIAYDIGRRLVPTALNLRLDKSLLSFWQRNVHSSILPHRDVPAITARLKFERFKDRVPVRKREDLRLDAGREIAAAVGVERFVLRGRAARRIAGRVARNA